MKDHDKDQGNENDQENGNDNNKIKKWMMAKTTIQWQWPRRPRMATKMTITHEMMTMTK